ncbi:hypothetical protein RKLH11_3188 [Rhodobacteraceae bacterium KLH11]|nr:hypothetical protein RKLH11_3188 [Rhodobacteraceae bacterium KLH11]
MSGNIEDELRKILDGLKVDASNKADKVASLNGEATSLKAHIADLSKLVDTAKKAEEEYELAYPALAATQEELDGFRGFTLPDLIKELREDGVEGVRGIIAKLVRDLECIEERIGKLKGQIPDASRSCDKHVWIRGEIGDAAVDVAVAEKTFIAAETALAHATNLAAAVADRQKRMIKARDEIIKLSHTGHEATAFWLLTEGCRCAHPADSEKEPTDCDECAKAVITPLDRNDFFSGMIEPRLIKPEDHEIKDAWEAFQKARDDLGKKQAVLKALQDELKDAEKKFDDLTKNLSKNTREALAAWQIARVDPTS